jgi:hypothetical protein
MKYESDAQYGRSGHKLGHTTVSACEIPVLGRQEAAADDFRLRLLDVGSECLGAC